MAPQVLVLDFEYTRDLDDARIAHPTELGAVLVSVEHNSILQTMSTLFPVEADEMRQRKSKLSVGLTREIETNFASMVMFSAMVESCDYVISHGKTDAQFCLGNHHPIPQIKRLFIDALHTRWGAGKGIALEARCRYHGVPNLCQHRALPDALALTQCLLVGGNLQELLANGVRYDPEMSLK